MSINKEALRNVLDEAIAKLGGEVSLKRLFPEEWMAEHTQFPTISDFLAFAGIESQAQFDDWSEGSADPFVSAHTEFSDWQEMLQNAGVRFAQRKVDRIQQGDWTEETFDTGDLASDLHINLTFRAV